MTHRNSPEHPDIQYVSDSLIDQLVDGELDEATRQRLLAQLDTEPGGWRRCALAFLEAQAWSQAMNSSQGWASQTTLSMDDRSSSLAQPSKLPQPLVPPLPSNVPKKGLGTERTIRKPALLAASLLFAFALGWLARTGAPSRSTAPSMENQANNHTQPVPLHERSTRVASDSPHSRPSIVNQGEEDATPLMRNDSVAQTDVGEWEFASTPAQLNSIVRLLERQGFQADRQQRLLPVELNNGERYGLPVEDVRFRYVGHPTY